MKLYFEGPPGKTLGLVGRLEGSAGGRPAHFRQSFEVTGIGNDPVGLVFNGSGWRRRPLTHHEAVTGFKIWKSGERDDTVLVPEDDPEMTRQLRALGYLQ